MRRALLLALGLALVAPVQAWAQSADLESELDGARGQREELAEDLGELRSRRESAEEELAHIGARLADAEGRLAHARGQVALAEEALREAEDARDEAAAEHERAQERLAQAERELAREQEVLEAQVVDGFKHGNTGARRSEALIDILRRVEDPSGFATSMKQLEAVIDAQDGVVETVVALREQRATRAEDAARARARANEAAAEAADTLSVVEDLRAEAEALAEDVATEKRAQEQLLAELRAQEQDTAATLERAAARQAELEDELRAQREAEQARSQRSPGGGDGGGAAVAGGACPVQGAVAGRDFTNDWGYPRSGGRTHEGTDVFAERGRPVIAIDDGRVVRMNGPSSPSDLGGITVTYRTADGDEWYNAHLDGVAGGVSVGAPVTAGQQIGTVGNSGNARSTPPHLHIQRKVGGDWVNPYPTLRDLCR